MWNCEAERFGSLEIYDKLELGRLLDRQFAGLFTLEDAPHIIAGLTKRVGISGAIAHQAACHDLQATGKAGGNSVAHRQFRDLLASIAKEHIAAGENPADVLLSEICEQVIDLTFGAGLNRNELKPE